LVINVAIAQTNGRGRYDRDAALHVLHQLPAPLIEDFHVHGFIMPQTAGTGTGAVDYR
jgi:hypothetical protein